MERVPPVPLTFANVTRAGGTRSRHVCKRCRHGNKRYRNRPVSVTVVAGDGSRRFLSRGSAPRACREAQRRGCVGRLSAKGASAQRRRNRGAAGAAAHVPRDTLRGHVKGPQITAPPGPPRPAVPPPLPRPAPPRAATKYRSGGRGAPCAAGWPKQIRAAQGRGSVQAVPSSVVAARRGGAVR